LIELKTIMAPESRDTDADVEVNNVNIAADIFTENWHFIYSVIRSRVSDRNRADDIFQNFFLSLAAVPPSGDIKNIKSYLYRAIMNDIIDDSRRIQRYYSCLNKYAEEFERSDAEGAPENKFIETEEMKKMFECIEKQLQRREAQAIVLRYGKNYKIKDIAAEMGVNKIAAWRYIEKGVRGIKRFLDRGELL
jgi:RNA polymerase sigma factor (sigma-70 family)